MKTREFIRENHNIVQAVVEMHDDHEVQMAREQCYSAASDAIELHRMLKNVSERQGLEGWVQEKLTLAQNYLQQVKKHMEHELMQRHSQGFDESSAGATASGSVATAIPHHNPQTQYAHRPDRGRIPAVQRKKTHGDNWMIQSRDLDDPHRHLSSNATIRGNQQ